MMDRVGSLALRLHCRMACIRTETDGFVEIEIDFLLFDPAGTNERVSTQSNREE